MSHSALHRRIRREAWTLTLTVFAIVVVGAQAPAVTTIAQGSTSGITAPREVVIRSPEDWRSLWQVHSSDPVPEIDFSQSMVAGVFLGSRPTAGYGVDITTATSDGDRLVLEYMVREPGEGALVAQVLTAPYHLVALPRHADPIDFREVPARP